MADMLLTGQRVLPRVAEAHGYRWRYAELDPALRASARL
jgi:NAD dependent epimerase/dehydratase family enzyme